MAEKYTRFAEFYPFYLSQHAHPRCRQLHFIGSSLVLGCLILAIWSGSGYFLLATPFFGYGFAWLGHFFFERNRPASFSQPLYSFLSDWLMYWQLLSGQIGFQAD